MICSEFIKVEETGRKNVEKNYNSNTPAKRCEAIDDPLNYFQLNSSESDDCNRKERTKVVRLNDFRNKLSIIASIKCYG